jgi:5-enolpyruvylshikimate-3-phosphate synthase
MADILVSQSKLEGKIIPPFCEEIALRAIIIAAFNNGGVIANCPETKKIMQLIECLNELGGDIVYSQNKVDIFPILKQKNKVDLKNNLAISRFLLPLGFFSEQKIDFLNVFLPKKLLEELKRYSQNFEVFINQNNKTITIGGPIKEEYAFFKEDVGSFFAPGFMVGSIATNTEVIFGLDDFVSKHISIVHTKKTFDLLNIIYSYTEEGSFLYGVKEKLNEIELEIPFDPRMGFIYACAFLLAGEGKILMDYFDCPQMEFLEKIKTNGIKKTSDGFWISKEEFSLPENINPTIYPPSILPTIFVLATACNSPTAIGPFVPYKQNNLKNIERFVEELKKIGAKIEKKEDTYEITPSKLYGGVVQTYQNPANAMAFINAGLICQTPLKIKDIDKIIQIDRYFIDNLKACGGKINF